MRRRGMVQRVAMVAAGTALVSGSALATSAGPVGAGAASAASSTVVCTHLTASAVTGDGKIKGCPVASTGGKGTLELFLNSVSGIDWADGSTTLFSNKAQMRRSGCPLAHHTSQQALHLKGPVRQ